MADLQKDQPIDEDQLNSAEYELDFLDFRQCEIEAKLQMLESRNQASIKSYEQVKRESSSLRERMQETLDAMN